MKVAVIGSRTLEVDDLSKYLPPETTEIISGGARGVDTCARQYALDHGIKLTEYLPDYAAHGRGAPLLRNLAIIGAAAWCWLFGMAAAMAPDLSLNTADSKTCRCGCSCIACHCMARHCMAAPKKPFDKSPKHAIMKRQKY